MTRLREGDEVWLCSVWTKTPAHNKVHATITQVTVSETFDDDMCNVIDDENVGYYCNMSELILTKYDALMKTVTALERWRESHK